MLLSKEEMDRVDIQTIHLAPFNVKLRRYAPVIIKVFKFVRPFLKFNKTTGAIVDGVIMLMESILNGDNEN